MHTVRPLSAGLILLMSVATGLSVASNYYIQPLLATLSQSYGLDPAGAGSLVMLAQGGYAAGLLLLVPLGDLLERRSLIVLMTLATAASLLLTAWSPALPVLVAGVLLTGLFSVVAQVLLPMAALLSGPAERGRVVGTIMSGLVLGILLARTLAGLVSQFAGWRTVYVLAAGLMALTAGLLWRSLPESRPGARMSYPALLGSVLALLRSTPVLQWHAVLGALAFAIFSCVWTPLALLLSGAPYHYADGTIGLFGLVGAVGAAAARFAGSQALGREGARTARLAWIVLLLSWAALLAGQRHLAGLLAGIVLLDLAIQVIHVANLARLHALMPEARSRMTSAYMTCCFAGGALGSLLSARAFAAAGWAGCVLVGAVCAAAGLAVWCWQGAGRVADMPA